MTLDELLLTKTKLHIGCGANYDPQYINIDIDDPDQSQGRKIAPDISMDFRDIPFPREFYTEIQCHFLFEHYQRQDAIAILCQWNRILKIGGVLCVSVPDAEASILEWAKPDTTYNRRKMLARHLWGSHEGEWATHHEAWWGRLFKEALECTGYTVVRIENNPCGWPSIKATATKTGAPDLLKIREYFAPYQPGSVLPYWMDAVKKEIDRA